VTVEWLGLVCLAVLGAIFLVLDARARAWCTEMQIQSDEQFEKRLAPPSAADFPSSPIAATPDRREARQG